MTLPPATFFAQMKARWASETVCCIRREDGSVVEDEEEILSEIGTYYTEIFTKDDVV